MAQVQIQSVIRSGKKNCRYQVVCLADNSVWSTVLPQDFTTGSIVEVPENELSQQGLGRSISSIRETFREVCNESTFALTEDFNLSEYEI